MSQETSADPYADSPLIRDTLDSPGDRFADTTVVDVDVHVVYTPELRKKVANAMVKPWADYVDPEKTAPGFSRPSPGIPKSLGGKKEFNVRHADDADTIYRDLCEGLGIDHPVINLLTGADTTWNTQRAVEEIRGVNTVLLDEFLDEYDEFLGAGTVTLREPDKAAEEIDRLGNEKQIVAAYMFTGTQYQKPPGDPSYDIMYQAMEDNDLTPLYHVTNFTDCAGWLEKFETAMAWHSLGPPWSLQQAVASLIAQGTPEKFPDLDFVIAEGGLGWVPFLMGRLNRERAQWQPEVSILEKSPEEYLRDQFYFSTQPMEELNDPAHTSQLLEIVGADSLLFATDYPHYDFDNPSTLDRFLQDFSPEDREKVLHGNATEVFGL